MVRILAITVALLATCQGYPQDEIQARGNFDSKVPVRAKFGNVFRNSAKGKESADEDSEASITTTVEQPEDHFPSTSSESPVDREEVKPWYTQGKYDSDEDSDEDDSSEEKDEKPWANPSKKGGKMNVDNAERNRPPGKFRLSIKLDYDRGVWKGEGKVKKGAFKDFEDRRNSQEEEEIETSPVQLDLPGFIKPDFSWHKKIETEGSDEEDDFQSPRGKYFAPWKGVLGFPPFPHGFDAEDSRKSEVGLWRGPELPPVMNYRGPGGRGEDEGNYRQGFNRFDQFRDSPYPLPAEVDFPRESYHQKAPWSGSPWDRRELFKPQFDFRPRESFRIPQKPFLNSWDGGYRKGGLGDHQFPREDSYQRGEAPWQKGREDFDFHRRFEHPVGPDRDGFKIPHASKPDLWHETEDDEDFFGVPPKPILAPWQRFPIDDQNFGHPNFPRDFEIPSRPKMTPWDKFHDSEQGIGFPDFHRDGPHKPDQAPWNKFFSDREMNEHPNFQRGHFGHLPELQQDHWNKFSGFDDDGVHQNFPRGGYRIPSKPYQANWKNFPTDEEYSMHQNFPKGGYGIPHKPDQAPWMKFLANREDSHKLDFPRGGYGIPPRPSQAPWMKSSSDEEDSMHQNFPKGGYGIPPEPDQASWKKFQADEEDSDKPNFQGGGYGIPSRPSKGPWKKFSTDEEDSMKQNLPQSGFRIPPQPNQASWKKFQADEADSKKPNFPQDDFVIPPKPVQTPWKKFQADGEGRDKPNFPQGGLDTPQKQDFTSWSSNTNKEELGSQHGNQGGDNPPRPSGDFQRPGGVRPQFLDYKNKQGDAVSGDFEQDASGTPPKIQTRFFPHFYAYAH